MIYETICFQFNPWCIRFNSSLASNIAVIFLWTWKVRYLYFDQLYIIENILYNTIYIYTFMPRLFDSSMWLIEMKKNKLDIVLHYLISAQFRWSNCLESATYQTIFHRSGIYTISVFIVRRWKPVRESCRSSQGCQAYRYTRKTNIVPHSRFVQTNSFIGYISSFCNKARIRTRVPYGLWWIANKFPIDGKWHLLM